MARGAIHVTSHAVLRYQQRVANVSMEDAKAALQSETIALAVRFGAPYVKLGTGQHVLIRNGNVVTVIPAGTTPNFFRPGREQFHEDEG